MKRFCLLMICLIANTAICTSEPLPDLFFLTNSQFGGYGRLVWDAQSARYQLHEGRIHSYVVDGQSIRLMRPEESGGTMANPQALVVLDGKVFVNSAYGRIHRLDPNTGALLDRFSYSDFQFGGSGAPVSLYASEKALLLLDRDHLISLDSELKKLGEKKLKSRVGHVRLSPNYIQAGSKLYALEIDNPNTYTDCAGNCNLRTVIRETSIDFSDPRNINIMSREEPIKEMKLLMHTAVDVAERGWFLLDHNFKEKKLTLTWHSSDKLSMPIATLELPKDSRVLAMTKSAPLWMVVKISNAYFLDSVERKGAKLTRKSFPLNWVQGYEPVFKLKALERKLFLTAGHQLAIFQLKDGKPQLLHRQDFTSPANQASLFQFEELIPASVARAEVKLNRARFEAVLKKDFFDDRDRLTIEAEMAKLRPSDTWAIETFRELLKRRSVAYQGGTTYAVMGLEKFGPAAKGAVPDLIYATMEGSAIKGDVLAIVVRALTKIDPKGSATREVLPACIKKTYVCEHVGKEILRALNI